MFKRYRDKLFCFSPPVMFATFFIEFGFAFYTIWRYKQSTIKKLVVATLFGLGTFQLSEYMLCGGLGISNVDWARIGYMSITLLPAFGIHMVVTLAGKKMPALITTAYATCGAFVAFYLLGANSISHQACYSNYAVFSTSEGVGLPFALYYYGWMIIGTWLAWFWGDQLPKRKKALRAMSIGYMAFILPTTFFNIIDPSTVSGIPSIMCGFAVLLAFILVLKVMPNCQEAKLKVRDTKDNRQKV